MSDEGTAPPQQPAVQITVPDDAKRGEYANFLVVTHSPHEFTLDFCQVVTGTDPERMQAEVVSRVKLAPTMVGKVIRALNDNLTGYEEKFGLVKEIG
ncbi:MAG TPA: DUF3467 domain-containing protein [Egibacteraceae bacterium]|nr:DUF3467 domain-containing protein [Egibacteraceae bacterium]